MFHHQVLKKKKIIVEIGIITVKHNTTENRPHPCFKYLIIYS